MGVPFYMILSQNQSTTLSSTFGVPCVGFARVESFDVTSGSRTRSYYCSSSAAIKPDTTAQPVMSSLTKHAVELTKHARNAWVSRSHYKSVCVKQSSDVYFEQTFVFETDEAVFEMSVGGTTAPIGTGALSIIIHRFVVYIT